MQLSPLVRIIEGRTAADAALNPALSDADTMVVAGKKLKNHWKKAQGIGDSILKLRVEKRFASFPRDTLAWLVDLESLNTESLFRDFHCTSVIFLQNLTLCRNQGCCAFNKEAGAFDLPFIE
jgi:hypothetical protein